MGTLDRTSKIGFIGAGTVGGALAAVLGTKGYPVVANASRTFSSAQRLAERVVGCVAYPEGQEVVDASDVVFITTPDDAIESVTSSLTWRSGQAAVHCSGSLSADIFDHAVQQGAMAGAMHPIMAFSSVDNGIKSIPGTTFGVEGEKGLTAYLQNIVSTVGGYSVIVDAEDKALYHASAALMGGMLSMLGATAAQLWEEFGFRRSDGVRALAPMMRQVATNLETQDVPGGVQGPYARGDIGTIRKHLETLESRVPEILPLYCEIALTGMPFAIEKGSMEPGSTEQIQDLLEHYRKKGPR